MPRKHLRFLLLALYDILRFFVMINLIFPFAQGAQGTPELNNLLLKTPYPASCAPSVLFPIICFFLWLDKNTYGSYLYLYAAGKIISVVALSVWLYFFFNTNVIIAAFALNEFSNLIRLLISPLLCATDILSLIIVFLVRNNPAP